VICLFCPKCGDEFQGGYTHCKNCNVDLVVELPMGAEVKKSENPQSFLKLFENNVAKWLKIGGIIYIFLGSLYHIAFYFSRINKTTRTELLVLDTIHLGYMVFYSILWGLLYFGLGRIIEILKAGFNDAK
jgi:hypothetical protein